MAASQTICEWDATADLLLVCFAENAPPAIPLFAFAFVGRSQVFLGEVPAGAETAVLRAGEDWSVFSVGLFDDDADPLTDLNRARWRFVFDRALAYEAATEDGPQRRTALRFFRSAPAGGLEALDGPEIADGATPGAFLETLAAEHHADPAAEAFAAQATVRADVARTDAPGGASGAGRAQGPSVRAWPDPREPLDARFSWAEESYEDGDALLLPGFETSRTPMVEVDLTRFGEHAERVARSFCFLHAPLTADGYGRGWETARGEIEESDGRILLRQIWAAAQHRDLIGVARRNGLPLRPVGPLRGLGDAPYETDAPIGALYLGETLRPEPNIHSTETLGDQIAEALAHAQAAAHGFDEAEAAAAFGLGWAQAATEAPGGGRFDLGGSAQAAPATVQAFLDLARAARLADGAARQALERMVGVAFDFETFRQDADLIWALLSFDDLAAATLESFADPRRGKGAAPRRMARALLGKDGEAVWDDLKPAEAPHAWRLLRHGVDLRKMRAKQFAIEPGLPAPAIVTAALNAGEQDEADVARARRVMRDLGRDFEAADTPASLSEAVRQAETVREARAALAEEAAILHRAFRAAELPEPPSEQALWDQLAAPLSPARRGLQLAELAGENEALREALTGLRILSPRIAAQRLLESDRRAEETLVDFLAKLSTALGLPRTADRSAMRREIAALRALSARGAGPDRAPPRWRGDWALEKQAQLQEGLRQQMEEAEHALAVAHGGDASKAPAEARDWLAAAGAGQDWIVARKLWRALREELDKRTHGPAEKGERRRSLALAAPPDSQSWRAREAAQLKRRMTAPVSAWPAIALAAEPLITGGASGAGPARG